MVVTMSGPSSPPGGSLPRVLIADDDSDVRAVLSAQLAPAFDVVATATDTDEAIALAAEHQADIAIVDVQMPGGGGVRATEGIRGAAPATAIVALSADESERVVLDMLRAGAVTYVRKGVGADELAALLRESLRAQSELPAREG
jgi:DNA-binding NarL/FixJ family response regulator